MEQKQMCSSPICDRLPPLSAKYPWFVAQDLEAEDDIDVQIFYNIHDPLCHYRCRIPELLGKRIHDKTVSKVKGAQGAEFNSTTDESHLPFDLLELIMLEFCVGLEYINFRTTCKRCHLAAPIIKWCNQTASKRAVKTQGLWSSAFYGRDVYALCNKGGVDVFKELGDEDYTWEFVLEEAPTSDCTTFLGALSQGKQLTAVAPSESKAANKLKENPLPEPKQPAFFTEASCPGLETPPSVLLVSVSVTALPEPDLQASTFLKPSTMADHLNFKSLYNPVTGIYTSPRPPINVPPSSTSIFTHLYRNLYTHSTSPALIDPYTQLKQIINNFAHTLYHKHKISKNDVVLIVSPNSILFPVAFLSVTSIGAIVTAANPLYTVAELAHQVNDSKPKLIITVDQLVHKVNAFNIPITDLNCIDQTVKKSVKKLGENDYLQTVKKLGENVNMDDVAAILYSSGTTGLSKGVVLTNRSIIATSLMMTSDHEMYNEGKCVFLCVVPLFHIMGLVSFT
nr:4-coumarate--CoA ligase-like 7 [Tanacetum cinerariifolium]